jgi:hypothetical protein
MRRRKDILVGVGDDIFYFVIFVPCTFDNVLYVGKDSYRRDFFWSCLS